MSLEETFTNTSASAGRKKLCLKDLVVCKFASCNQIFEDARILPCGNRTCSKHIPEMALRLNESRRLISCYFCGRLHRLPETGEEFPADTSLSHLFDMSSCQEHESAKSSFDRVTELVVKLVKTSDMDYVTERFKNLEAKIMSEKETLSNRLNEHYQQVMRELNANKDACLSQLKENGAKLVVETQAIRRSAIRYEEELRKQRFDFDLKTWNGDRERWIFIQAECQRIYENLKMLDKELSDKLLNDNLMSNRLMNQQTLSNFAVELSDLTRN